jgi:hypothetical protein
MRFRAPLLLSFLATIATGCNDPNDLVTPPTARLRIVNAAPGTSSVLVLRDNENTALATLNFRASNGTCATIPLGSHVIHFRVGTTTLASSAPVAFLANRTYMVVLTALNTTNEANIFLDDFTAATSFNGLRFINTTATPGDVYVIEPTGTPGTATTTNLQNLGETTVEPIFYATATANTKVQFFNNGVTTGTPRVDFTLTTTATRRLATVFLSEETPGTFQVNACP